MDDIIIRLERAKGENFGHYSAPPLTPILESAIREIERLRATNKRLRDDYSYEIWGEPADD